MLWIVEATRLGETAAIRTCVDAESWQRALEAVRVKRGEGTDLGSFSVELVPGGVRAIDPMARVKFVVDQAPPGTKPDLFAGSTAIRPSGGPPRPKTPLQDFSKTRMGGPELAPYSSNKDVPPVAREDVGAPIAGVSHTLCTRREQDPSTESPLVYREYTFAVPPGTSAGDAERVLRIELSRVQRALESKVSGRYVNLAAFDHTFTERPLRAPLATLAWKDWTNQTVTAYPGLVSARPGGAPPRVQTNRPAAPVSARPAAPEQASAIAPTAPQPALATTVSAAAMIAGVDEPAAPGDTTTVSGPPSAAAKSTGDAPLEPMRPRTSSRHKISTRKISAPSRAARATSDQLISSLFDVMHDLQFAKDALQGGSFCLEIANEAIPHEVGFVHMYDVAKRNFVVACFHGTAPMETLASRIIESDSAIARALRSKNPIVMVSDRDPIPQLARHSRISPPKSLIVAPMLYGSRVLGAIEVVSPSDGDPFTTDEALAVGYIASQYAEFIASHGIVLDRARILAHALG